MYSQMFHAFSVLVQQELSPVDEQSLVAQAGLLLQSAKTNNICQIYISDTVCIVVANQIVIADRS